MADETIAISISVDAADSAKSVGDLKKSIKDLKNAALEAEAQGNKTLADAYVKAAGKATDKLGDLNKQVQNLSSDTKKLDGAIGVIQGLAGGFAAAQGAAALFGGSGKELEKTMLKVQAATALATGVQQIANTVQKESAASMFVLSTATSAYNLVVGASTGALKLFRIALAATGIGAIAIAVYELYENFDKVKKVLSNLIPESVQKTFTWLKDAVGSLYDKTKQFLGLGEEAKSKNPFGILDQFTQKAGENKKALSELIEKQKEQAEYLKKLSDSGSPGSIGYYTFLLSQSTEQLNKLVPGTKSYNDELAKNIQLQKDLAEATEAARIAKVNSERKDTPIESIKSGGLTPIKENPEVKLEVLKQDAIGNAVKKGIEERKKLAKAENDFKIQIAKDGLSLIQNLTELFRGKNLAGQKRAFQINKQAAAAQAIISTYEGATKALASAPNPILGFVEAGLVVAAGIANVAKIEAQKFEGGASGGGATPSASFATQGGGEQSIPSINQPTTQLNGNQTDKHSKVYVTETDIKRTINRVNVIEARARFG